MVTFLQAQTAYDIACNAYMAAAWFVTAQVVPDAVEGFAGLLLTDGPPPVVIPKQINGVTVIVQTAPVAPAQSVLDAWAAASPIDTSNFAGTPPANLVELTNRMATLLTVLNGNQPIP